MHAMPDQSRGGSEDNHDLSGTISERPNSIKTTDSPTGAPNLSERLATSRSTRTVVVGTVFAITTFLYLWYSLLGFGSFAAVDMNELGDPYRSAVDRPAAIANVIQTDQVEVIPYIVAFTEGLKDFEYRLWDPNVAAGVPLGSLPTFLIASPFNIGFLISPAWYAIGLKVALQFLLSQVLMYLFLRRLRIGVLPAVLGAVLYTFAGSNVVLIHRMTVSFIVPGALWAAHRVVTKLRWRDIVLLGGFIAWGWLEGFPSGWVYLVYLTVGWIVWLVVVSLIADVRSEVPRVWRTAIKRAVAGASGVIIGAMLAAFTLIPFVVELIDRGTFEGRLAASSVPPLRPAQILGLVQGSTLGEWRGAGYDWWTGTNPVESVALIGAVGSLLVLIGWGAASARRLRLPSTARAAWSFLSLVAGLSVLATYFGTPVLTIVNRLPGLAGNPVNRTRFVVALAAATVGAMALDWLMSQHSKGEQANREQWRAPWAVSTAMIIGAIVVLVAAVRDWVPLARSAGQLRVAATATMWTVGVSILVVVFAAWLTRRPRYVLPVGIVITAVVFVQLALPYHGFTPTAPVEDFYSATRAHETIDQLAGDDYRFGATGLTSFYPNGSQVVGAPDIRGAALHSREFKNLIESVNPIAFSRDAFKIIMTRDEWNLTSPVLDHLAVKYFALDTREPPFGVQQDFRLESVATSINGSGPYSVAYGRQGESFFIVQSDEMTPTANVAFPNDPGSVVALLNPSEAGMRVAAGDLLDSDDDEILLAPAHTGGDLYVFDVSGSLLQTISIGQPTPPGGWWPAIGDPDGDGANEIVLGAGAGSSPQVLVLDVDGSIEATFLAFGEGFRGGATAGVGDVDGDGVDEIVVGAGDGGGPHVRVLNSEGVLEFDFFAYDMTHTGGVAVSVGDPLAGGSLEIVTAPLDGSQPLKVFSGATHVASSPAEGADYNRIASGDIDGHAADEILIGSDAPISGSITVATMTADFVPSGWQPLDGPATRTVEATGPFSGVSIDLDVGDGCPEGRIAVTAIDGSSGRQYVTRRNLADIPTGWTAFAIDGNWASAGDEVTMIVENDSSCSVQIAASSIATGPALRFISPDPVLRLVSTDQAWVYERPDAWPLVSAHARWRAYATQEDALADIDVDPEVVRFVGRPSTASQDGPAPRILESTVSRQGAVVVTEGDASGIVVFSQNDALGWSVAIDGVTVDHVRVDGALLGVLVPSGHHRIEFTYLPNHFFFGLAVSSGTILLLGVVFLVRWVRRRKG